MSKTNGTAGNYVDRRKQLEQKQKEINLVEESIAVKCIQDLKCPERRFKFKIICPDLSTMLEAMVLPNEICVLVLPKLQEDAISIMFEADLEAKSMSGKRKKGAKVNYMFATLFIFWNIFLSKKSVIYTLLIKKGYQSGFSNS